MSITRHSNASLALKPASVTSQYDSDELVKLCKQLDLIATPTHHNEIHSQHFIVGERFLDYINFLGCSPQITFDVPHGDKNFTHVVLQQYPKPQLFYGQHTRAPHCPACKKSQPLWQQAVASKSDNWICSNCDRSSAVSEYNWRKTAGYAHTIIEITDIYPKEAIPQPALLDQLAHATGFEWDYFYY